MTEPTILPARPRGGGTAVVAALAAANGLGYLLTLVASRRLGPDGYGALAALLGVILIGNVLALALQAVVARRTVVANALPGNDGEPVGTAWASRLTRGAALVAVALGLLAAAPLTRLLHLDTPVPAVLLAATLGPLTLIGGQLGVLQGGERFHALAQLYLVAGIGKVGGGVVGVLLTDSVTGTMAGTFAGAALAAVIGAVLVSRSHGSPADRGHALPPGAARETVRATYSLGALFALANLDVVLARHFLEPRQAGLYAIGAVLAKGAFWLPSFVPVIAMPGLADPTPPAAYGGAGAGRRDRGRAARHGGDGGARRVRGPPRRRRGVCLAGRPSVVVRGHRCPARGRPAAALLPARRRGPPRRPAHVARRGRRNSSDLALAARQRDRCSHHGAGHGGGCCAARSAGRGPRT